MLTTRYWFCIWLTLAGIGPASADVPPHIGDVPPVIQRNYAAACQRYQASPENDEAAWQLGRACFDRAEFARHRSERASLANQGMAVCTKLIARSPSLAAGHYYLAMNMAQLARTELLGALSLVRKMESQWLIARSLDDKFDYAGPDRFLGLLYRDAPGAPISLGNSAEARKHLLRAVAISPNFPENHLNLIETYLLWNKTSAAADALEKLRAQLPAAHKEFATEYWEPSWQDWNSRLKEIQLALTARQPKHK